MIVEYINGILHAMWNMLLYNIFCGNTRKSLLNFKTFVFVVLVSTIQLIAFITGWSWYYHIKMVFIIAILYLYGRETNQDFRKINLLSYCVDTYISTVLLDCW